MFLGLSLFWTEAKNRGFNISDINKLMTKNPAKLAGLHKRKGEIKEGYDADFVIWDPESNFNLSEEMIYHKNKVSLSILCIKNVLQNHVFLGHSIFGENFLWKSK